MMENKLLSIIIPAYNMEAYIERNLDSLVKARNIDRTEIILVNDGSKDSTLSIARRYEERLPSVVSIIDKPNGHYGSCINAAFRTAHGKYFRILDADDWFDTAALEEFIDKLEHCDADLVVTLRVEIETDDNGNKTATRFPIKGIIYNHIYDAENFRIADYSENVEFNMHSMTYKTDVLQDIGFSLPEGICYTDMLYCLMPVGVIKTLIVYDISLYHYLVGRTGSSTTDDSIRKNFSNILRVTADMLAYVNAHPPKSEAVRANQMRFLNEATAMFMDSLRRQHSVSKKDYVLVGAIVDGWKKHGVESRLFKKYYYRYWLKANSHFALNLSLLVYKIFHPFK